MFLHIVWMMSPFSISYGASQELPSQFVYQEMPSHKFAQDDGPSQEFALSEPTKRRVMRGTNFTKKEDEALCNAWRCTCI
jgi:hypothetical protein